MVRLTIKSLLEVIKQKDKTITDYELIAKENNDIIKFLEERLETTKKHLKSMTEVKDNTIRLLEERNGILTETARVRQEYIEIKEEQKEQLRKRLLSLSIGQRLFSWKKIILKNFP